MKNKIIFISVLFFLFTNYVFAMESENANSLYSLTNYKIPLNKKGASIGQLIGSEMKSKIKLLEDTAKLFSVSKDGNVRLKKNVMLKDDNASFRYSVTLGWDNQRVEFELVKDEFIKNKVIAHRGAWKKEKMAQNSIRSLQHAIQLGCEGSEFDVWLSADKVPVLSHDPVIGGLTVEESSVKDLKDIILPTDDKIATLEEYITEIKNQNKTRLILEIKPSGMGMERTLELTDSIITLVHRMKAQAWVEYISFDYESLKRVYALDKTAQTAYLTGDKTIHEVKNDNITGIDYSFYSYRDDTSLNQKAHGIGLKTNVWTVNTKDELELYYEQGLDYITTDEPELLLEIIENKKRTHDEKE